MCGGGGGGGGGGAEYFKELALQSSVIRDSLPGLPRIYAYICRRIDTSQLTNIQNVTFSVEMLESLYSRKESFARLRPISGPPVSPSRRQTAVTTGGVHRAHRLFLGQFISADSGNSRNV